MSIKLLIKQRGDVPGARPLEEKTFNGPIVTIGSDQASTLRLNDAGVAPEQAVLICEQNQWLLINRAEGTALNDEKLAREARRPLTDGDSLHIGQHSISLLFKEALPGTTSPGTTSLKEATDAPHLAAQTEDFTDTPETPSTTPLNAPSRETSQRSFAKILESLRTIEDSFYFMIEGGAQAGKRVPIETTVMLIGLDQSGLNISFETGTIATPCAVVRKDWSGVVAQPIGSGTININDEPLDAEQRLREGDRLHLVSPGLPDAQSVPALIFHEPATLAVLDSIYQQKPEPEPAPHAQDEQESSTSAPTPSSAPAASGVAAPAVKFFSADKKYFGYFTLLELLMMLVGTLVAAVIFFLALVYFKPVR